MAEIECIVKQIKPLDGTVWGIAKHFMDLQILPHNPW